MLKSNYIEVVASVAYVAHLLLVLLWLSEVRRLAVVGLVLISYLCVGGLVAAGIRGHGATTKEGCARRVDGVADALPSCASPLLRMLCIRVSVCVHRMLTGVGCCTQA